MAKKATEKQIVYAAARKHGIPGWLLWGMYGAENGWDYNNGVPFGLIMHTYPQLNGGKGRTFNNGGIAEAADIAAELVASLAKEHGGLSGAISAYSGGEYTIAHPRELAQSKKGGGKSVLASAPFHLPLPGPLDPGNIWEEAEGLGGTIGGLFGIGGGGGLPGKAGEIESGLNSVVNILGFFKGLGELLLTPEGWLRLAKLIGGSICVLWGLRIVIHESTGSDPVKTITKATETAAAVATIK